MKYENELYKTIEIVTSKMLKKLGFDITLTGVVNEVGTGQYLVSYNDTQQWIKARDGLVLDVGNIVYIRCVKGNLSEKFIDCKKP